MDTLGKRIALYRHMRQWTQERLASEVNVTQSTLSDIENDKSSPTWKLIADIAHALDVPVLSLLPESDDSHGRTNPLGADAAVSGNPEREFAALNQLIQTKDELIRAKDELIRELRGKTRRKDPSI